MHVEDIAPWAQEADRLVALDRDNEASDGARADAVLTARMEFDFSALATDLRGAIAGAKSFFSNRRRDEVLAALRYWRRERGNAPAEIREIASDDPLDDQEIEAFCAAIGRETSNVGCEPRTTTDQERRCVMPEYTVHVYAVYRTPVKVKAESQQAAIKKAADAFDPDSGEREFACQFTGYTVDEEDDTEFVRTVHYDADARPLS